MEGMLSDLLTLLGTLIKHYGVSKVRGQTSWSEVHALLLSRMESVVSWVHHKTVLYCTYTPPQKRSLVVLNRNRQKRGWVIFRPALRLPV